MQTSACLFVSWAHIMYRAPALINTDRESARASAHHQKTSVWAELRPVSGRLNAVAARPHAARRALSLARWADQSAAGEACGKYCRVHVQYVHRKAKRHRSAVQASAVIHWTCREVLVHNADHHPTETVLLLLLFPTWMNNLKGVVMRRVETEQRFVPDKRRSTHMFTRGATTPHLPAASVCTPQQGSVPLSSFREDYCCFLQAECVGVLLVWSCVVGKWLHGYCLLDASKHTGLCSLIM